ncbi:GRF1-interacting factor 1-like [Papaver somniferum]|uniref:GRF1-interacting factor 1-like n=1 Tax=Papaver somniferum TaxID=3469 RepID=UPI000E700EC2|nr:GRF1-interacting factor 1-like [Papaver somniferum]
MAAAYNPNNLTSEQIQQYLDENKSLIIKILENQTTGNVSELAEQNLAYLNAIAYSQPQQPTTRTQLLNAVQQGAHYMQHQQAHALTPQLSTAARFPMLYAQQPMFATPQQLHSQLGMIHTEGRIHGN